MNIVNGSSPAPWYETKFRFTRVLVEMVKILYTADVIYHRQLRSCLDSPYRYSTRPSISKRCQLIKIVRYWMKEVHISRWLFLFAFLRKLKLTKSVKCYSEALRSISYFSFLFAFEISSFILLIIKFLDCEHQI